MASAGSSLMGIGTATGMSPKAIWPFILVMLPTGELSIVLHSHARLMIEFVVSVNFLCHFISVSPFGIIFQVILFM